MMRNLLLATIVAALPFAAQAQTANIAVGGAVTTLDPHFYNNAPNDMISTYIFDNLTDRDANTQPVPSLAMSWRVIAPTVWELSLRPGVTWHDGQPFTADDVAFSLARIPHVPNSVSGFAGLVRAITKVEIVDPLTIRLHTEAPHPLLITELGTVAIVSRHIGETATTEDYNSGRAAIGTGPFRLQSYRPGDRAEFVRNDAWWGGAQHWARVNYRFVPNPAARTAALLSGDVDMIDQVPTGDLARLCASPSVSVFEKTGGRMLYLSMNYSRKGTPPYATANDGQKLAANPFQDVRVRRAMSISINRVALARQLMEGTATPSGQWLPPGAFGYNEAVGVPAYDPAAAKKLLAEAGYPEGFHLTLHSPNDRYQNDAATAQAVAQMWSRIGVQTQVEAMPWSVFSARSFRQDFDMRLIGWGNGTGEASYALVNIMATYDAARGLGSSNSGRYSNPALDALSERAQETLDDAQRRALLEQAAKLAMDDVAFIPLYQLSNYWATRKGLAYTPRIDEATRAVYLRPAE